MEILNNIPVKVDPQKVRKILHLERNRDARLVESLIEKAITRIVPQAAFKLCYIDEKMDDAVIVEGLQLQSNVLRKNLNSVERLFPYVVTLGPGLAETSGGISDPLEI